MHNAKPRCKKNRECLRQLYKANHLYLMKWHLSRHEPGTKLSPSNQQKPTAREGQRNRNRRKSQNKNKNSPHSNWSLHNNPPRDIRNIIPEPPAQHMPALPHNCSPLIKQHRSHNYNKKPRSQIRTQKHQIEE
jgi:hypothetical protein